MENFHTAVQILRLLTSIRPSSVHVLRLSTRMLLATNGWLVVLEYFLHNCSSCGQFAQSVASCLLSIFEIRDPRSWRARPSYEVISGAPGVGLIASGPISINLSGESRRGARPAVLRGFSRLASRWRFVDKFARAGQVTGAFWVPPVSPRARPNRHTGGPASPTITAACLASDDGFERICRISSQRRR